MMLARRLKKNVMIQALGRLRQEDCEPRLAWDAQQDLVSKQNRVIPSSPQTECLRSTGWFILVLLKFWDMAGNPRQGVILGK